jgi:hypothetical protein
MEPPRNDPSEMPEQNDPPAVRDCLHRLLRLLAKTVVKQLHSERGQRPVTEERPS